MREAWLDQLEALLAGADDATAVVTVASVAGRELEVEPDELRGAGRRALLVLAAGGDPSRGLDLDGPAVIGLASELDAPERREAIEDGLFRLLEQAKGLPHVSEAVRGLLAQRDIAWRAYACSLLAEELSEAD
jgi:hypothetical protein